MAVDWTPHRFAGGLLALDTTNTVVLRGRPGKTFDRFDDSAEITRFAAAASVFRAEELGGRRLDAADASRIRPVVIVLREAIDRLFRGMAAEGQFDTACLRALLGACAEGLAGHDGPIGAPGRPFGDPSTPIAYEAALCVSALSLLSGGMAAKVRICANCDWLFVDRSRNSSRLWCDMAVCGNRQKAKRHYRRRRCGSEGELEDHGHG